MGFFEDTVLQAKSLAKTVGKKAGDVIDISKKKLDVADLTAKTEKFYAALGKLRYDEVKNGADHTTEAEQIMEEIDRLAGVLEEINESINELKNVKRCPNCELENTPESNFCRQCGQKLGDEA